MYNKIINPKTNRKVNINSDKGLKIITKYINYIGKYQKGGLIIEKNPMNFSEYNVLNDFENISVKNIFNGLKKILFGNKSSKSIINIQNNINKTKKIIDKEEEKVKKLNKDKEEIMNEKKIVEKKKEIENNFSTLREENQLNIEKREKELKEKNAQYNKEKYIGKLKQLEQKKEILRQLEVDEAKKNAIKENKELTEKEKVKENMLGYLEEEFEKCENSEEDLSDCLNKKCIEREKNLKYEECNKFVDQLIKTEQSFVSD